MRRKREGRGGGKRGNKKDMAQVGAGPWEKIPCVCGGLAARRAAFCQVPQTYIPAFCVMGLSYVTRLSQADGRGREEALP